MTPEEHYAEAERVRAAALNAHTADREGFSGWQRRELIELAQVHATLATRIVPVELSPVLVSGADPLPDSGPENIPDFIPAKVSPTSAADPADLAAEKPAAAATPDVVAAGSDRRESVRLCAEHWRKLTLLAFDAAARDAGLDALVGMCSYLAGERLPALFEQCPVCWLNDRGATHLYDRLIAFAVHHAAVTA